MYRMKNQIFELLVFCEMIEAIVRLLLCCFAVFVFGGVVLLFLSLIVYACFAPVNSNIFFHFLIIYLFSMIHSVCLCSLHYFTFMCLFSIPLWLCLRVTDNCHTCLFSSLSPHSLLVRSPFHSFCCVVCSISSLSKKCVHFAVIFHTYKEY